MRSRWLFVLACLGMSLLVPSARADVLDVELNKQMPSIVEALQKNNYANVGVLRFRVEEEGKPQRFDAALCGSMPQRIENLLIMHGGPDEATAVGVIHNASLIAQ